MNTNESLQLLLLMLLSEDILKINSVLELKEVFTLRNGKRKIDELIEIFLENLEDDIHDMLCDHKGVDENYRGLDSEAIVMQLRKLKPLYGSSRKSF